MQFGTVLKGVYLKTLYLFMFYVVQAVHSVLQ